jgi:hypothetical protein
MELQGNQLSLVVDDRDAVYPINIDPLFSQSKKVTAPDPSEFARFGSGVAIDGDTLVVGAYRGPRYAAGRRPTSFNAIKAGQTTGLWSKSWLPQMECLVMASAGPLP